MSTNIDTGSAQTESKGTGYGLGRLSSLFGFSGQSARRTADSIDYSGRAFSSHDPAKMHPFAGLGEKLDYLLIEEEQPNQITGSETAVPSRGFSDDLCYGTGTAYLGGLAIGGLWGIKEGFSRNIVNSSARLRLNSVLNGLGRRGSFLGNSAGVLAIVYNLANSSLDRYRGSSDIYNSLVSATFSGLLFKSTAGLRPAVVSAGIMASGAAAWDLTKRKLAASPV